MRKQKWMLAFGLVLAAAGTSLAGWELEQTTYSLRSSGKEIGRSTATLRISKDRVRTIDGVTVTIYDYDKDQVTLLLPEKKIFWGGTVDEYLSAIRAANPNRRGLPGELKQAANPDLQIQEAPITLEIAGKPTKKYVVQVDGRPYQELWVTPAFLGEDLDVQRYQAVQRKLSQSVRSSYATNQRALGENELFKKVSAESYPLRTHTYLGDAIMGTEVLRITQKEIPDSDFAVPAGYTRTPLISLIEAQQAIGDRDFAAEKKKLEAQAKAKKPTPAKAKKDSTRK